jgi:hypothetical protein
MCDQALHLRTQHHFENLSKSQQSDFDPELLPICKETYIILPLIPPFTMSISVSLFIHPFAHF